MVRTSRLTWRCLGIVRLRILEQLLARRGERSRALVILIAASLSLRRPERWSPRSTQGTPIPGVPYKPLGMVIWYCRELRRGPRLLKHQQLAVEQQHFQLVPGH